MQSKTIQLFLAVGLATTLGACGAADQGGEGAKPEETTAPTPAVTSSPTTAPTPTTTSSPSSSSDDDKKRIRITKEAKGAKAKTLSLWRYSQECLYSYMVYNYI